MDILPSQNAGIKGVFFDAMTLMKKMVAASVHPTKVKNLRFWSWPTMKTMIYTRFGAPFFSINLVTLNLDFNEKKYSKKRCKTSPFQRPWITTPIPTPPIFRSSYGPVIDYNWANTVYLWLGVIQQLCGPNFTQFSSPPSSSGQLWTFHMMSRDQAGLVTFPLPTTSCPRSYWMSPIYFSEQ